MPQLEHRLEIFVCHAAALGERDTDRVVLLFEPADTDGGLSATATEPVERCDLLRGDDRIVQRQNGDHRADGDRRGGACDEGLGSGGVEVMIPGQLEMGRWGQEVLWQKYHRITQLLGVLGDSRNVGTGELMFPGLRDGGDVHAIG